MFNTLRRRNQLRMLAAEKRAKNPDFGTIGGVPTVAELMDLVKAHQYSIDQIQKTFDANQTLVIKKDPTWLADWSVLKARWKAARAKADDLIDDWRLFPDELSPAGPEYVWLLKSVQLSYPELRTSPGDLVDLAGRLARIGVSTDFSQMPQPRAGTDFDLSTLQAADAVIKAATPSPKNQALLIAGGILAGLVALRILVPFKL